MESFSFIIPSLCLCALNVEAQITATISPDRDYSAPFDAKSMVRFNCTGTGAIVQWRVDGIEANTMVIVKRGVITTPAQDIGEGVFFSSLFIPASKENDNTSIQCTTVRVKPMLSVNNSELVFLNIQGLLGAPPNLTLSQTDENTIILSWDAPETLDLMDIEPDILYYTVCYNLTDDLYCVNVSSSEKRELLIHSEDDIPMLFTVAAVNVVGEGNASSILFHKPTNSPTIPTNTTHSRIPG